MNLNRVTIFSLLALAAGCGGPLEEYPQPEAITQMSSGVTDYPLQYIANSTENVVGKLCEDPQNVAGSSVDWRWEVAGVPADYLPVTMKAVGSELGGFWRASAISPAGSNSLGRCDANYRWPLVFKVKSYDPATNTRTWVLYTEPLHAGAPLASSTFSLFFMDSGGLKSRADHVR